MNRIPAAPKPLSTAAISAARRAIERAVRQAVPTFADFCLVHLVAGRAIRCVAGAHSTRGGRLDIRALTKVHRIRPDDPDSTVAMVVRTGRATLRRAIHPEIPGHARRGGVMELHQRLAPTSALVVPIVHGSRVLGALSLCYSHSGRAYAARHVRPAERLASRIASSLVPDAPFDVPSDPRAKGHAVAHGAVQRRITVGH